MTQEEKKKVSMRDLPEAKMKSEDIRGFMKPVGIPGLPFPMSKIVKTANGLSHVVGWVDGAKLQIPSEQSIERIYGKMLRELATPQMMSMTRDILMRLQPGSKNRVFAVLGDPATGKSHEFKKIASLVHPKGALVVDCGGMNMRELFFRTVIDYGQGQKEQFERFVKEGKIAGKHLETLEEQFPGSVVRDENNTVSINWSAVGEPRRDADDAAKNEDRGAANRRAVSILNDIYELSGIDIKKNSFGIKTVDGDIIVCRREGRPLFLDEFTKCQKETLDAYQNYLDWENGNAHEDTVMIPNTMTTSDGQSPQYATLSRKDTKLGWILGIAGNEAKDGITTHTLSDSMMSRLQPTRISEPNLAAFEQRISQYFTGFPLTTWYALREGDAKADPAGFADELWRLRTIGLTPLEIKSIPPHEEKLLRGFDGEKHAFVKTIEAIKAVAQAYYTTSQLKPGSSLLENDKKFKFDDDEIAAGYKNIAVTLRTPLDHLKKALQGLPKVVPAAFTTIKIDFNAASNFSMESVPSAAPAWHTLGANLTEVVLEWIENSTQSMPKTAAALLALWETQGCIDANLGDGKASSKINSISELLKYDVLANEGIGNTEELMAIRTILAANLRGKDSKIKASDEDLLPLTSLGRTIKMLDDLAQSETETFVVPNDDVQTFSEQPVIATAAVPSYALHKEVSGDTAEGTLAKLLSEKRLVDYRTALSALALPKFAEKNRELIWPVGFDSDIKDLSEDEVEAYKILKGQSPLRFDMMVLTAANKKGTDRTDMVVIMDRELNKTLVVGDEEISPALSVELSKSDIIYVNRKDEGGVKKIDDFASNGVRERCNTGLISDDMMENMLTRSIQAISGIYDFGDMESEGGERDVDAGATLGTVLHRINGKPGLYTAIVKPANKKAMSR